MPQTALETALANAYPQDLEKLAVDLLSERGYDVEPTGTTGADGGLDARLADGDRVGALHVSRTTSGPVQLKLPRSRTRRQLSGHSTLPNPSHRPHSEPERPPG
jgi:hypothetical protein